MADRPRKFCKWQRECKEDVGKETYTCTADLDSARAFQCRYGESEIKLMDWYNDGKLRFTLLTGSGGRCTDFELISEVKNDLIKKVVEDLEKS